MENNRTAVVGKRMTASPEVAKGLRKKLEAAKGAGAKKGVPEGKRSRGENRRSPAG